MSTVVRFEDYRKRRSPPPLVFLDMHREQLDDDIGFGTEQIEPVLARCRVLLDRARAERWPLAFMRPVVGTRGRQARSSPRWIEGFEPRRSDMVFDRLALSCYASVEFAEAMSAAGNVYVIAGFADEGTCLATLIDASQNNHSVGFIRDATATPPLPGYGAAESRRVVDALATRYATIITAEHWIKAAGARHGRPEMSHVGADR